MDLLGIAVIEKPEDDLAADLRRQAMQEHRLIVGGENIPLEG